MEFDFNRIETYEELKEKIKPLDLIVFRGGDCISDFISELEKECVDTGVFTHSGIIVTTEILNIPEIEEGKLYIMESTFSYDIPDIINSGPPDIMTGHGKFGVQLREFEEVVKDYISNKTTKVAWCNLIKKIEYNEETKDKFQKIFENYIGRFYDLNFIDLFASLFPKLRELRHLDTKLSNLIFSHFLKHKYLPSGWQFCSELVANIYKKFNILPESINPKNVVPVDFFGYGDVPCIVDKPIFFKKIE